MAGREYDDLVEVPDDAGKLDEHIGEGGRGGRGGRGRERGKGRGGAAGGAGRGGMSRETQISKALSQLLRHKAESQGISLDEEGFAKLDEVLKWPRLASMKATFEEILSAVNNSDKQRFAMKPSPSSTPTNPTTYLIRANQGHTIPLSAASLLTPLTLTSPLPPLAIHGTFFFFYPLILASGGLKPMQRNHIHFATGLPEDENSGVVSGMRRDAEVLIYVDVRRALEKGVEWWVSENGVVLTDGGEGGVLGTEFWVRAVGRRGGVGVLWEGGRVVGEVPEGLRGRRPRGKEGVVKVGGGGKKGSGSKRKGKGRGKGEKGEEGEEGGDVDAAVDAGVDVDVDVGKEKEGLGSEA